MDIKRVNTVIAAVHPTDDSVYSCKLMGDNLVRLNFRTSSPIDLQVGDHIMWRGNPFTLNTQHTVKEVSTLEIEYNCVFEGVDYELEKTGYKLFDNTSAPLQGDFSLTGSAAMFVSLLVDNLNRNGSGWSVGNVVESDVKTLTFTGSSCLEVLQRLATEYETEFYVTGSKTINLAKKPGAGSVITLSYGQGSGLKWLRRINRDSDPIVTCLFAYGSAKNLPYGYRGGATRLMLPDTGYLLQNVSLYGVREGDKIYENIYPRLAAGGANDPGMVTAVTSYLKFIDANLDFDVNDTLSSDPAKVAFNTGELAGYEFDIASFDNTTKTFTIISADKEGITLPSVSICPAVGDKYVLLNIKMPQEYVTRAELELAEKALSYLDEYSRTRDSFNAECDILHFKANNIVLETAQVIRIQSTVLSVDREIRVIGFTQNLNEPYRYDFELGEKPATGKLEKLSGDVNSTAAAVTSNRKLSWQTTLELLALIRGASSATDFSNITGLPVDNDALSKYLNAFPDAKSELLSGAIVWDHDLTYQATEIQYKILGVPYASKAQEITLENSDPTFSRIDTFYVDMFGNLNVATGSPASNPTSTILNSTQLLVMTVLVGASATEPSDTNVEKIYDETASEEWNMSLTNDTYVSVNFASNDSPRTGSVRIKVAINVPDTVVASPLHYIGERYQGGIIFDLDPSGKKGLIAADADTATDVFYSNLSGSSSYTTGALGEAIGTGKENTLLMLANDAAKDDAAKYCDDLIVEEIYTDWYLPSIEELKAMYFNRFKIGGLGTKTYWSSTENSWKRALCVSFSNGVSYVRDKNNRYCVRAIRSFDDASLTNNKPVQTLTPVNTKLTFSSPGPFAVQNGILSLFVKSTMPWRENSMLLVESYLGLIKTGSVVISPSTNRYGYRSESDQWQLIAIMASKFNASRDTLDGFRISFVGSWPNKIDLGIDMIRYQYSKFEIKKESTLEIGAKLTPAPDGIIVEFTTPKPYKPGTTMVYDCGVKLKKDTDYVETGGKIVFAQPPGVNEILTCDYYTL